MKKFQYQIILLLPAFAIAVCISCKKYLDAKPDKTAGVAATLEDAQLLLDNYSAFNSNYPAIADLSDDNYRLDDGRFNVLDLNSRNYYSWATDATADYEWNGLYQSVLNATTALETVEGIKKDAANAALWNSLKGTALFYKAYALLTLAQYYAGIYDSTTAANQPGVPLRMTSDVAVKSVRASLKETWELVELYFKTAAGLLPVTTAIKTRPCKAAAYAALARTCLSMGKFANAAAAADSSLQLYNALIDYNAVDSNATMPFSRFGDEVIFHCTTGWGNGLDVSSYTLDTLLYASYDINDLRRAVYFTLNGYNGYGFKGSYSGDPYGAFFSGIATDEVMLIKAECLARTGKVNEAMNTLNQLLITRWRAGTFIPLAVATEAEALQLILKERRKELILRGTRWFDMRRLSNDPVNAVTAKRHLNGEDILLSPGNSRYTFLIPQTVIDLTGMQQNTR